jgi:prephenate dehydrogenase
VTRLASGSPEMHRDICLTNRAALSHWLTTMASQLLELREQLNGGNAQAVEELFTHARGEREAWLQLKPNLRPGEEAYLGQNIPTERPSLFGRLPRRERK